MPAYVRPQMVAVCTGDDRTHTARNGVPRDVHKAWNGVLYGLTLVLLLLAGIS